MDIIGVLLNILLGLVLIGAILYVLFWIIIGILRVIEIFKGQIDGPIEKYLKSKSQEDAYE